MSDEWRFIFISGALKLESWNEEVEQWMARVRCVAKWFPERRFISYSDDEIRLIIEEFCEGAVRFKDLADKPVTERDEPSIRAI